MIPSLNKIIFTIFALFTTVIYLHAGENISIGELVRYDTVNSQIPRSWIYTITNQFISKSTHNVYLGNE
jgi:hypothetical protein